MSDLAKLFTTKVDGPAQPVLYRQGIIVEMNSATLENKVLVGTTVLENLPVLGVAEAASMVPGSVVGIHCIGSTWAIVGRFVVPGSAAAIDAISLLSSKTKAAVVNVQETTSSTTLGDLATVGPVVTVDIGASGRALLLLSAKAGWSVVAPDQPSGARMTAELSGTNTVAPSFTWGAWTFSQYGSTSFTLVDCTISSAYVFEGLNPGLTTFTAKYRSDTAGISVDFNRRTMVVIAL